MGLGGGGPHAHQRRLAERAEVGRRLLHLGLGAAAALAGGDPERRRDGEDNGQDAGTFPKGALVRMCAFDMRLVLYAAARGSVYSATCKISSPIIPSHLARWPARSSLPVR